MDAYQLAAQLYGALAPPRQGGGPIWGTVSAVVGATATVTPDGDDAPTEGVSVLSSARGLRAGDRALLDTHSGELFVVSYVLDSPRM